jgi:hypothetical protein
MFVEYAAFIFSGGVSDMLDSAKYTENTQNQGEQTPLNTPRRSDDGLLGRNM